ncbi:MAG: hypothetical protein WEE03_10650 [Chloroflexota bacterium]
MYGLASVSSRLAEAAGPAGELGQAPRIAGEPRLHERVHRALLIRPMTIAYKDFIRLVQPKVIELGVQPAQT